MQNKYAFRITPLAADDIDSALEYISVNLCNGKAARDLYGKIVNIVDNICLFPYAADNCEFFLISDNSIRHVIIDNFVLVYEIKEEDKQVIVLRFCSARMDLTKIDLSEN